MQPIAQLLREVTRSTSPVVTPDPEQLAAAHERYQWTCYHPGLGEVMPAAVAFREAVLAREQPRRWLTLLGPSGCGKTHLLKQLFADLETRMRVRTTTGWRGAQAAHIIPAADLQDFRAPRDYADYDLVYVEDIGSGADDTAGSGKVLRSRIAELLQLRSGKWTLLCANLTIEEVASRLDGRIASRLRRDGSWLVKIGDEVPDFWWSNSELTDG
jgi:chromosomal replication initiation ATPase DnaA